MRRHIGSRGEKCYKHAAPTGLGLFVTHAAINMPPLQG